MTEMHRQVFAAIENLPRPITVEAALREGLAIIPETSPARQEWEAWMQSNGAQLIQMLNRGAP